MPAPSTGQEARFRKVTALRPGGWQGTDAELLDQVLGGHPGAAGRLYDRFAPDLNRVVWKLLGADPDHDDLVHDVFIKVWKLAAAGRVREPDRLASWVVAVAVHTVHKELRRRYVRRRFASADVATQPTTVSTDVESRDLLRAVYEVLSRIAPEDRIAWSLRYLDDRRLAEVAELCDCSLATVKRRISRAERRFAVLARPYPAILSLLSGRHWGDAS